MKSFLKQIIFTFIGVNSIWGQTSCDTVSIYANDSTSSVCIERVDNVLHMYSNNIPDHGDTYNQPQFTLGPEEIKKLTCAYPVIGDSVISLYEESESVGCSDTYEFGISTNGVKFDPNSADYWTYVDSITGDTINNLDWHIEASSEHNSIGQNMGENGGHLNPFGYYHYHKAPSVYYVDSLGIDGSEHSPIVGYAADGFPIYYKYAYQDTTASDSTIVGLSSGYTLKSGTRGGDGYSSPRGIHTGNYVEDYEYTGSELDECNGRYGVTPEYPYGTYYYVLTDEFPYIPRCFKGDFLDPNFRIGPGAACPSSTASSDCAVVVEGCMDPVANNYNSNANKDDGSCDYSGTVSLKDLSLIIKKVEVQNSRVWIESQQSIQEIIVSNYLGQKMSHKRGLNSSTHLTQHLIPGQYLIQLRLLDGTQVNLRTQIVP